MSQHALIHLHPDFEAPLKLLLRNWNSVQDGVEFVGLRVKRTLEKRLLTPGTISDDVASSIADAIRRDAGFDTGDGIVVFTERRLYDNEHYQLFVGGREAGEEPPRVGILSLDFLRRIYDESKAKEPLLFRAIISNLLFSIGTDAGLAAHGTRGCIMDFCSYMPDIFKGLRGGPRFCATCTTFMSAQERAFLVDLACAAREFANIDSIDLDVTEAIQLRAKRYTQEKGRFDYDVALSFAGPDRNKASLLAEALKRRGLDVFYDEFGRANLWGKNLQTYLGELYRLRAKYCVVLMSSDYSRSRWTQLELQAALAREFQEDNEYVLPVKLDDATVEGILPTRAYVRWEEESPDSIANLVAQKVNRADAEQ